MNPHEFMQIEQTLSTLKFKIDVCNSSLEERQKVLSRRPHNKVFQESVAELTKELQEFQEEFESTHKLYIENGGQKKFGIVFYFIKWLSICSAYFVYEKPRNVGALN